MSQPTLYYFNGRGFGELPRLVLTYAGVQFKDVRLEELDDALRARLPYGQVPFYEDDDIQVAQTSTITRYLANKHKLAGSTEVEKVIVDSLFETIWDVLNPYFTVHNEEEKLNKYKAETLPKFLTKWESILSKNGGKNFIGKSLTYADIAIFYALDYLKYFKVDWVNTTTYPTLSAFYKSIPEIPVLKKYLEERPQEVKF